MIFVSSLSFPNYGTSSSQFVFVFQLMSPSTAFSLPESEKYTAQHLTTVLDAKVRALQ